MYKKYQRTFPALAGAIGLSSLIPASAIVIRDDLNNPAGIAQHNAIANNSAFAATGFQSDAGGSPHCTGTLVSATKYITAAHCWDSNADGVVEQAAANTHFGVSRNPGVGGANNVASVALHPSWAGSMDPQFDLAVVTLSSPINGVPFASLTDADVTGQQATKIGYGQQGDGAGPIPGVLAGAQQGLGGHNMVDAFTSNTWRTDFDSPAGTSSTLGSATALPNEVATAPGDSGGPLWVGGQLAGVLNGGFSGTGGGGGGGGTGVPEPTLAFALGLLGLASGCRRRRPDSVKA